MILAKTLFGDEGEILTEELLFHGQDFASNLLYRAGKKLALLRTGPMPESSDQCKEIRTIITKLYLTYVEMIKCHFIARVGSPYLSQSTIEEDQKTDNFAKVPLLNMPESIKYQPPNIDTNVIIGKLIYLFATESKMNICDQGNLNTSI